MMSGMILVGLSIVFFVFAATVSVLVWGDMAFLPKIGLFISAFGSGGGAGKCIAERSR